MYDRTPAAFGDLTRRWTHLADEDRARRMAWLLGEACLSLQLPRLPRLRGLAAIPTTSTSAPHHPLSMTFGPSETAPLRVFG
ncbi:MAG: hypothetical protein ABR592_11600 [Nitriliruptorales bacterium]